MIYRGNVGKKGRDEQKNNIISRTGGVERRVQKRIARKKKK